MTYGVTIKYGARFYAVDTGACAPILLAADDWYHSNAYPQINAVSCSAEPVNAGTIICFNNGGCEPVTAVSYAPASLPPPDSGTLGAGTLGTGWQSSVFLLQAVLVCAVVFMFVRGFDSGNKL